MIIICDRRFAPGNLVYIRENSKDDLLDMFIQNQRMRIRNCICYDTHLRISSDTCVALLHLFLWNKERCTSLFIIMFTQQFHQMDPMFRGWVFVKIPVEDWQSKPVLGSIYDMAGPVFCSVDVYMDFTAPWLAFVKVFPCKHRKRCGSHPWFL